MNVAILEHKEHNRRKDKHSKLLYYSSVPRILKSSGIAIVLLSCLGASSCTVALLPMQLPCCLHVCNNLGVCDLYEN